MSDDLFVYGTLRSEFDNPHAERLRREADLLGPATVRGSIFRVASYPGYLREPDGIVHGELWRLRTPERTLAELDDYEGAEYSRVRVPVETPGGNAWIYLYRNEAVPGKRIGSGDFLKP